MIHTFRAGGGAGADEVSGRSGTQLPPGTITASAGHSTAAVGTSAGLSAAAVGTITMDTLPAGRMAVNSQISLSVVRAYMDVLLQGNDDRNLLSLMTLNWFGCLVDMSVSQMLQHDTKSAAPLYAKTMARANEDPMGPADGPCRPVLLYRSSALSMSCEQALPVTSLS